MGRVVYYLRVLSIIYFKQKKTRYIQHIYIQIKSSKQYQNYQKFNWTPFKYHVEDLIFCKPHSTNIHKESMRQTNIHEAILDADRLFILKENQNSTNWTHLPRHICKLIEQRNHTFKRNRSPQIITLIIT